MSKHRSLFPLAIGTALLCTTAFTSPAFAQDASSNDWQFRASAYGYFPDVSSTASLPTGASANIDLEADDLIEHTDSAFMGMFEAQHGRFGAFVDAMYFNIGNSVNDSNSISIGGGTPLPPGVTVDGNFDLKMWVLTLAGNYRVFESSNATVDLFGGARMLDIDTSFRYAFNTDIGPFSGPLRQGSASGSMQNWDVIVGSKGRYAFGTNNRWYVQYYADVGAGDSDLTWQVFGGVGRSFGPVDVTLGYRHLAYEFGNDSPIEDLSFDGPVIGASYNF